MESPFKYLGGCLWCFNQPVVSGRDVLGADWCGIEFFAILGKEVALAIWSIAAWTVLASSWSEA